MNIAISFSGDGFGHTSRMVALSQLLQNYHQLIFWSPECTHPFLKRYFPSSSVCSLPLLSLVKKDNQVQLLATFWANKKTLFFNSRTIRELAQQLKDLNIDAVIADFEPLLVHAAKVAKIPVLLFNHQGVVKKYPWLQFQAIFTHIANYFMMPKTKDMIVSSFYSGDVGPIIREEIKSCTKGKEDFIVVYLKASLRHKLLPILKAFPEQEFRIFPDQSLDFVDSLTHCKAVISAAGHQLISECLYLQKPMLVLPEISQYEQFLNAVMLQKTGWGQIADQNNLAHSIRHFLQRIHHFPFAQIKDINFIFHDDLVNAGHKVLTWLQQVSSSSDVPLQQLESEMISHSF